MVVMKRIILKIIIFLIMFIPYSVFATEISISNTNTASSTLINSLEPLTASFTADQLFDRMEKKTEKIDAIEAKVELFDDISSSSVILRVKNPDKFSINFLDGSSSVFFNGSKLWIYIKSINECFFYSSEPSTWWSQYKYYFVSFFDPKKIFVNMTRNTLKTLFEIKALKREETTDGDYHYYLKLTPKLKDIFIQVFELGYYEAVFSEKIYLPVKVLEYDTKNKLKNTLIVKSYKMNEEISDDNFEYENTTNAILVPISIVIMQKFEDYKDKLVNKINETTESMKNKLLNWGF
jgi:outer membrane lipoprotein-sorting protein